MNCDSRQKGEAELLKATRAFTEEDRARGWFHLLTSLSGWIAVATFASGPWPLWARAASSLCASALFVRVFVLFHDVMHGAILRRSLWAKILLYPFAWLTLTPPRIWRETHNYHHAHTAKLVGSHVGSFATTTPQIFRAWPWRLRWGYLAQRHPLNLLLAPLTIFGFGMCLLPFIRSPRRNWDAALPLIVSVVFCALLGRRCGPAVVWFSYGIPLWGACVLGAYLFYAQHNCPQIVLQPRQEWSGVRAALASSSHLRMGMVMRYFTANIGFHHIHHLNPAIPFYRLPEVAAALPELKAQAETSFHPVEVIRCLRLKFWDATEGKWLCHLPPNPGNDKGRMVRFRPWAQG